LFSIRQARLKSVSSVQSNPKSVCNGSASRSVSESRRRKPAEKARSVVPLILSSSHQTGGASWLPQVHENGGSESTAMQEGSVGIAREKTKGRNSSCEDQLELSLLRSGQDDRCFYLWPGPMIYIPE
jgi:hypothetical protein